MTSLVQSLQQEIKGLHPGNFALVMSTGIVALGLDEHAYSLASVFARLSIGLWLALIAFSLIRLVVHRDEVRIDLLNPRMVFSYFTLVAATGIVGVVLHGKGFIVFSLVCWCLAFLVWCSLLYLAFS